MKKKILVFALVMFFLLSSIRMMSRPAISIKIAIGQTFAANDIEASKTKIQKVQSEDTEESLVAYLKRKGHEDFLNVAKTIQNSCQHYNMPFEIILAIAILESGYGTSTIAREKQNFFALGAYDWDPLELASDFSNLSLGEAIDYQILILKNDYFSRHDTLEEIAQKYCKNSKHWLEQVRFISQEIKIQCKGGIK